MDSSAGSLGFGGALAGLVNFALGDIFSDTDWFDYPI